MILNKKNFFSKIDNFFLCELKPHIAVAVSGGPDSMALVYLLNEWIKINKGKLIALIIDHRLRINSYKESRYIKKYLNSININTQIIRVKNKKVIKKNMNEARINRYDSLINFCKKKNILHLFVGHHFNDNLETFLIRKVSGSNLEGLSSIPYQINRNKIQLVRPLLDYKKKDILKFNEKNNIKFINDPSNINTKFTRVAIRKYLLNKNNFNDVMKDFNRIKSYIYSYKIMINEILHKIIYLINTKNIILIFNDFNQLDLNIKEKLVEKIYVYFYPNKSKIRYSKVKFLISELDNKQNKSLNLASMFVKKDKKFLNFSKK